MIKPNQVSPFNSFEKMNVELSQMSINIFKEIENNLQCSFVEL